MVLVAATPGVSWALGAYPAAAGSPVAAVPSASVPGAGRTPDDRQLRWVPLVTGDQVAVNGNGDVVTVRLAEGRENIPIRVSSAGGHTYALPDDARNLVRDGRVDRSLFDVTRLSAPEYLQRRDLRLIVKYGEGRQAARAALRSSGGAEVERALPSIDADAVKAPANGDTALWSAVTDGSAGAVSRTVAPGIASVWLDGIAHASLDKSVPQIGGPEAWAAGFDGNGVRVAVLDTGIDTTHPDLSGQVVGEHNFSPSPTSEDLFGHGTHVASIAAGTGAKSGGRYKGVAPGARLLNGKVLGDSGGGDFSSIIAGMEWAAAEKADVVNLSLGSGYDSPEIDPMEEAVNRLSAEDGILFVVAAGNEGERGSGTLGSPTTAEAALSVGAVDKQDRIAPFSSTGPRVGDLGIKPDLTAPGVDIGAAAAHDSRMAQDGTPVADGYVGLSGTSMATPHVAGAAAILVQEHPDWTGDDIKKALVASTAVGPYTAYQQGSGRVDLRAAIKQTVVVRETSLGFGLASWPHASGQSTSKNLTYRNLGDSPVTLKVAVNATGPDGSPAPSGMFTTDGQVTVPAHGERSVKVTAATGLAGTPVGMFSGRISAVGGGQTVSTAVAVTLEQEMYNVTVKALNRMGEPAAGPSWDAQLQGVSGAARGESDFLGGDTHVVRVPKGQYFLSAWVRVDPAGSSEQGMDWLNQPNLVVSKDTAVTVDARAAKPIDVTVPDRRAEQIFGRVSASVGQPDGYITGFYTFVHSFTELRTAHIGPKARPDAHFSQVVDGTFVSAGKGHDEYQVQFQPQGDTFVTGFTHHTRAHELAALDVTIGAPAANKTGYLSMVTEAGGAVGAEYALPAKRTLHLLASSGKWSVSAYQPGTREHRGISYDAPGQVYKGGRSYRHTFNVGVFGPDLPEGAGIQRMASGFMDGTLPLFADSSGNTARNDTYDTVTSSMFRNGTLLTETHEPFWFPATLDARKADYRLEVSITRSVVADVSTRIDTSWSFSSAHVLVDTQLTMSVVRFTPDLSVNSTGRAKAKVWVPVTVKGHAAGRNLKSLSVQVSYDKGAHWTGLSVCDGRVRVANPHAGGSVSFKAKAVDRQGNVAEQTILNAYLTK